MFSATDIASFLACPHTATLARAESKGEITKPFFNDPTVDLLQKLGLDLKRQRGPVDVYTIEHIERPAAN